MPFLTIREVAQIERVSEKTVRNWIAQRRIVAYKRGRQYFIDPLSLGELYIPVI